MRIIVDKDKCVGCRYCEMICAWSHYKEFNPSLSRIRVNKNEISGAEWPSVCRQCDLCPSTDGCPEGAMQRGNDLESISVDIDKCSGCGICIEECVFGAVWMRADLEHVLVCDTCKGEPMCVSFCPVGAIEIVNISV